MTSAMRVLPIAVALCAILGVLPAFAQQGIPGIDSSVVLRMEPKYATPATKVRVYLQSTVIDVSLASTTWRVNDEVTAQGFGVNSIEFTTGSLGTQSVITAEIETDLAQARARIEVAPAEVDLLWESDAFTPPFYRGRSIPSAGTSVRMQAMPRFKDTNGKDIPLSNLIFTWRRNGAPLLSISGPGKSGATIPAPYLYGTDTIEVEVATSDYTLAAHAIARIASIEPRLMLYKDHPLFGTMYFEALGARTTVPDEELSFVAVPYFADAASANDRSLIYDWSVNGSPVAVNPMRPSMITIDAAHSTGIASIELGLTHITNFFLKKSGVWIVSFASVLESVDPFRGTEDPFRPVE